MRAIISAVMLLFIATPINVQNLSASNPETLVEAIRELGFKEVQFQKAAKAITR